MEIFPYQPLEIPDILYEIFIHLSLRNLYTIAVINKIWYKISQSLINKIHKTQPILRINHDKALRNELIIWLQNILKPIISKYNENLDSFIDLLYDEKVDCELNLQLPNVKYLQIINEYIWHYLHNNDNKNVTNINTVDKIWHFVYEENNKKLVNIIYTYDNRNLSLVLFCYLYLTNIHYYRSYKLTYKYNYKPYEMFRGLITSSMITTALES